MKPDSQTTAPSHRRIASDPVAAFNQPDLGQGLVCGGELELPSHYMTMPQEVLNNSESSFPSYGIDEMPSSFFVNEHKNPVQFNSSHVEDELSMDNKKLKRMLLNRASAQKYRLRKLAYIEQLQRDAIAEEAKISFLAPQVQYYEAQRMILKKENDEMKLKLEALETEKAFKEAEFEALKGELEGLIRQMTLAQNGK